MNYYFDSSALVKRYINESGSLEVKKLCKKADFVWICHLNILEIYSTVRRLQEENRITESEFETVIEQIELDISLFREIEYTLDIRNHAKEMIKRHQLKTLDAIHIASFLSKVNIFDAFVCCDKKLLKAAKSEGLKVINPMD